MDRKIIFLYLLKHQLTQVYEFSLNQKIHLYGQNIQ